MFGGLSVGYDSNPAQASDGDGFAFARYALAVQGETSARTTDIEWGLSTWYRDYEGANDSYRATLFSDWSFEPKPNSSLVTLAIEGSLYRDQLVPADERNEAALSLRYSHILSARLDLALHGDLRWLAYRNASLPWQGRPGSGTRGRPATGGTGEKYAVRRNDRIASLGIDGAQYWTPDLSTNLILAYARRDSQVQMEAYHQLGVGVAARFDPGQAWQLDLNLGWSRTDYDRGPQRLDRRDDSFATGIALQRKIGETELSCSLKYLDNRSTIDVKSFHQWETQCGLFRTF